MNKSQLNLEPVEYQAVYNLLINAECKLEASLLRNDLSPEAVERLNRQHDVIQGLIDKMRQDMAGWLMNCLHAYTKYRVEELGKITDDVRVMLSLADTEQETVREKVSEAKKTATLTVHLSEEGAEAVKKWAKYTGCSSTSAFIRQALSMTGCGRAQVVAKTDDLQEVSEALNMYNLHSGMLIDALLNHGEIQMKDIEELRRRMDEIYDAVQKCDVISTTERCIQRKNAERYIIHKIDDIFGITRGF